jgi:hypothetical protein
MYLLDSQQFVVFFDTILANSIESQNCLLTLYFGIIMRPQRLVLSCALMLASCGVLSATLGEPIGTKTSEGKYSYSWALEWLALSGSGHVV